MGIGYAKDLQIDTLARQTTEAIAYYVSSAGSDTNDGLTAETAFATIQHALDILPTNLKHNVTINVGTGNFAGFLVTGFIIPQGVVLLVQGTLGAFVPATGITSGTADGSGGSTSLLVDADGGWTINNLRGALLKIGTEWRIIRDNTSTTITVVGTFAATCNSKAYEIVEQKTVINSASRFPSTGYYVVVDANSTAKNGVKLADLKTSGGVAGYFLRGLGIRIDRLYSTQATSYGIILQQGIMECVAYDCAISSSVASAGGIGFAFSRATASTIARIFVFNSTFTYGMWYDSCMIGAAADWHVYNNNRSSSYGVLMQNTGAFDLTGTNSVISQTGTGCIGWSVYCCNYFKSTGSITINGVAGAGTYGYGMYFVGPLQANLSNLTITGCSSHGMHIGRQATVMSTTTSITANSGYGIYLCGNSEYIFRNGTQTVGTNSLGGVYVREGSYMLMDNTDGTNTGYGIIVDTGGRVTIDTATGVTGGTGDILLDDVAKTYVGQFGSNKNAVIGVAGSVVQRYDGLDYI